MIEDAEASSWTGIACGKDKYLIYFEMMLIFFIFVYLQLTGSWRTFIFFFFL